MPSGKPGRGNTKSLRRQTMPPQGSDDEPANQAACSRAPIAVAYRTGRPSRRPASIAGIHTHQSHQACRYSLTGNSWTGTYLAWVTFDDVTVGAEKEPASGLAIAEGGSGAATGADRWRSGRGRRRCHDTIARLLLVQVQWIRLLRAQLLWTRVRICLLRSRLLIWLLGIVGLSCIWAKRYKVSSFCNCVLPLVHRLGFEESGGLTASETSREPHHSETILQPWARSTAWEWLNKKAGGRSATSTG